MSADAAERLRRQPIGRGARLYPGGSVGAATSSTGSSAGSGPLGGADAVHLDHLHALQRHLRRQQIAQIGRTSALVEIDRAPARARCASA